MTDYTSEDEREDRRDHDLLIKIDGKLDIMIVNQKDHKLRIRDLEKWKWIAVIVGVAFMSTQLEPRHVLALLLR